MKNWKKIIACGAVLAVFFITSCGEGYDGNSETFDNDLRGYWVLHELDSDYDGDLEISSDWITIWGFYRNQTPPLGDDNDRPFKDFTKDIALKGYSEDGKFIIEDRGGLQELPYNFYKAGRNPEVCFLDFTFGEDTITMRKDGSGNYKDFDYDLRGTWVLHEPDPFYDGDLEISSDRITINGFYRIQTPPYWYDDNDRPFKDFTKDVALKGYSVNRKFFIEDRGMVQRVPYIFYKAGAYPEMHFLNFTFGNNTITMRKE